MKRKFKSCDKLPNKSSENLRQIEKDKTNHLKDLLFMNVCTSDDKQIKSTPSNANSTVTINDLPSHNGEIVEGTIKGDMVNRSQCADNYTEKVLSNTKDSTSHYACSNYVSENHGSNVDGNKTTPCLTLSPRGVKSLLNYPSSERCPLSIEDIRSLFDKTFSERTPCPKWCRLRKSENLDKVVVVVISGISLHHLGLADDPVDKSSYERHSGSAIDNSQILNRYPSWLSSSLKKSASCFGIHCDLEPLTLSKMETLEQMTCVHISKLTSELLHPIDSMNIADRSIRKHLSIVSEDPALFTRIHNDAFDRTSLLLEFSLLMSNYPVNIKGSVPSYVEGFKNTKKEYKKVTSDSPLFAIDCEMVLTSSNRLELAEVSIVNEKLQTVYATFVKPSGDIRNYLTKYSGITKRNLIDCKTRIWDVQKFICNYLPPDAILVGHSIDNDLQALKLMHPYIIDTAHIYCINGRTPSLKLLAKVFLNKEIQRSDQVGHDSWEDAKATLELVLLKLQHNAIFGDIRQNAIIPCNQTDVTYIQEDIDRQKIISSNAVLTETSNRMTDFNAYNAHLSRKACIFEKFIFQGIVPSIIVGENCYDGFYAKFSNKYVQEKATFYKAPNLVDALATSVSASKDHTFTFVYYQIEKEKIDDPKCGKKLLKQIDEGLFNIHSSLEEGSLFITVFMHKKNGKRGCVLLDIKGQNKDSFL